MKRVLLRIVAVLTATLIVVIGLYETITFAHENGGTTDGNTVTYFVKYGGTGDGLTAENPLATVDDAVKAANAAGFAKNDTVFVKVMQSDDWNWGAGTIGAGNNYRADAHHMTTWAARGRLTLHESTLVVEGFGLSPVYLASNGQLGFNLDMVLGGNTVFKNITIVRMRRWRGIYTNGYDVTYDEGTQFGCVNVDDCDANFSAWNGLVDIIDGTTTVSLGNVNALPDGCGGKTVFSNSPTEITTVISSIADIWGPGGVSGPTSDVERFSKDVTIVYNNVKLFSNIRWGNQVGGSSLFEKNLNIDIKSAGNIKYIDGAGSVSIKGALQIITSTDTDISAIPTNVSVDGGKWFIKNSAGADTIDFTEEAGKFSVACGEEVLATNDEDPSKVYFSENGVLSIPEGKYTVIRNGNGGSEITYYVQYGGKGDGLTPLSPLATVDEAIKASNALGFGKGDTVYIKVMQSDDWNWGAGTIGAGDNYRADAHHMTTWAARGAVANHRSTIIVEGYGDENVYLASNGQLGFNLDMVLGGNTIFQNITIVRMRRWRGLFANGYNVTYGKGTQFGCVNVDDCDATFTAWNGYIDTIDGTTTFSLGNVNALPAGGGGTIEFENEPSEITTVISSIADIWTDAGVFGPSGDVEKFTNTVSIIYNNNKLVSNIRFGNQNGGESIFEKDLNINVKSANRITFIEGSGKVTVNGNLQIISKSGTNFSAVSQNVTVKGEKWLISNSGCSGLIELTETAGKYLIKDDTIVVATNLDDETKTYTSKDGVLQIPAGRYSLSKYSEGGASATYYVKYGGTGDGLTAKTAMATVEDAVNAANEAGLGKGDTVYVNVIQSDDWNWGAGEIGAGKDYRSDPHHITTWAVRGAMVTHKSLLVVQGVGDNFSDPIYLASNGSLGLNLDMILGGPTVFRNISIVRMRRWRGLLTNGYDVIYDEDTQFGCVNVDDCDSEYKLWDGTVNLADGTSMIALGHNYQTADGGGGKVTFANEPTESTLCISSIYDLNSDIEKYKNDVNIVYNNSRFFQNIRWGNLEGGSTLFEKNLNINMLAVRKLSYFTGTGEVKINGGLQIIANCGELEDLDITTVPSNVKAELGKWFIVNNGNVELEFTETAGKFVIKNGQDIRIKNTKTKEYISSIKGILTIPAGSYVIEEIDDGVWWKKSDVDEGDDLSEVRFKGTFKNDNGKPISKAVLQLKSNDYTYNAKTDSNGRFDFGIIKASFYELFVIDGSKQHETGYFSNFKDGDIITANIVLTSSQDYLVLDEDEIPLGKIKANVYTPNLKPAKNLVVYLGDFAKATTDQKGYFEFNEIPDGEYEIYTIMKDESKQVLQKVVVKQNTELSMKLKYVPEKEKAQTKSVTIIWIVVSGSILLLGVSATTVMLLIKSKKRGCN